MSEARGFDQVFLQLKQQDTAGLIRPFQQSETLLKPVDTKQAQKFEIGVQKRGLDGVNVGTIICAVSSSQAQLFQVGEAVVRKRCSRHFMCAEIDGIILVCFLIDSIFFRVRVSLLRVLHELFGHIRTPAHHPDQRSNVIAAVDQPNARRQGKDEDSNSDIFDCNNCISRLPQAWSRGAFAV